MLINEKADRFIAHNSVPGADMSGFVSYIISGAVISSVYELGCFLLNYFPARARLYSEGFLISGSVITRFGALTDVCFIAAAVFILSMPGFILANFLSYRSGSMSVYLLRRLPRRGEGVRRAVTLPLLCALMFVLLYLFWLFVCYMIYVLCTPAGHLPAGSIL